MIKALLGVGGTPNPLVVGAAGKTVTIPATATAASLLNASMPGGSNPRELFGSCIVETPRALCWTAGTNTGTTYINTKGKINNVFLSQTITLGLNLRISSTLPGFQIQAGTMATADPVGGCGSTTPKVRSCYYDAILMKVVVVNEYTYRTILPSVINALDCKGYAHTVTGLFMLANDALGNVDGTIGSECGASLSDINAAVDAINNAFDECKVFIGWNVEACVPVVAPIAGGRTGTFADETGIVNDKPTVSAYPNPFNDRIRFIIKSPAAGQASLEVYNSLGQKMQTVYKGYLFVGRGETVDYFVPATQRTNLFYILRVGDKQVSGKLISIKQ
jgi:hypothetical protein